MLSTACAPRGPATPLAQTTAPQSAKNSTPATSSEPASEDQIMKRLDRIRAIGSAGVPNSTAAVNKELDEIGGYLKNHEASVRPILVRELDREAGAAAPNQFFLLDMGYAAARFGDADIALKALLRIDAKHPMITSSIDELFFFVHRVAREGRPEVLPAIDKLVLDSDRQVFIPQHMLKLDPGLQGVFLYGVFGTGSERYLVGLLERRQDRIVRVLEILNWLGTNQCIPNVVRTIDHHPDVETVKRAVGVMMRVGGATGRDALVALDRKRLEPAARDYLASIDETIRKVSFDSLTGSFGKRSARLPDADVRKRLELMVEHDGVDNETDVTAILESTIPTPELIERLARVRSSTLHRLSDEALSDVEVTNTLINALGYRKP